MIAPSFLRSILQTRVFMMRLTWDIVLVRAKLSELPSYLT